MKIQVILLVIVSTILKTINGGENWILGYYGRDSDLESVYFQMQILVILSVLWRNTKNHKWRNKLEHTLFRYYLYFIFGLFYRCKYRLCCWCHGGTILKTTNGGTNWITQNYSSTENLFSVYFADSITGYAVGISGTILKTTNSGTNWTTSDFRN